MTLMINKLLLNIATSLFLCTIKFILKSSVYLNKKKVSISGLKITTLQNLKTIYILSLDINLLKNIRTTLTNITHITAIGARHRAMYYLQYYSYHFFSIHMFYFYFYFK